MKKLLVRVKDKVKNKVPTRQMTLTIPDVKYSHWFVGILLCTSCFFIGRYYEKNYVDINANINRQLRGELTQAEKELQKKDAQINKLTSENKSHNQLNKELKADIGNKSKEIEDLKKKFKDANLEVSSLTKIIANLEGKTDQGTTNTDTKNGVTSFTWHDEYNRFHLTVPDIYKKYSEFTYNQHFKLNIVILKQESKSGALQVQTAHLYEITGDGKVINEAKIDLDKSTFSYAIDNQKTDQSVRHWLVSLDNKKELLVTWLPYSRYQGMFGAGMSIGSSGTSNFVGLTAMAFPPSWYHSGFGVGASVGYEYTDSRNRGITYRFQLAWSFSDLFKK